MLLFAQGMHLSCLHERWPRANGPIADPPETDFILSLEAKLRRAGKGKRLIIAKGINAELNQRLVELIKKAFAIRTQLRSGSDDSIAPSRRKSPSGAALFFAAS